MKNKSKYISNTSNEKLFSVFALTDFDSDYFTNVNISNVDEALKVNRALKTIINKGSGDGYSVTLSRIIRTYGEWHLNYKGEKDSIFINTDKMKSSVKEIIIDTAYRLEHKNGKSLDYKIVAGLTKIKR